MDFAGLSLADGGNDPDTRSHFEPLKAKFEASQDSAEMVAVLEWIF